MMKKLLLLLLLPTLWLPACSAADGSQPVRPADVLAALRLANDYFMACWPDPGTPTFVGKERPSSLWTRAVYYEGLMALYAIDPQPRYADYTDCWADSHHWTPRDGILTCDADNQCCSQIYLERYRQVGGEAKLQPTLQNIAHQMGTSATGRDAAGRYGFWTWIDAIQMAMPVYAQLTALTADARYMEHALRMYTWSRDTLAGGLFNRADGLWWRDADYTPPYREPDGQPCYWARGNGWVYAALVRVIDQLRAADTSAKAATSLSPRARRQLRQARRQLQKDFLAMTQALLKCQRPDGFWNVSLLSSHYAGPELTGTALFLYGMSWGIRNGLLPARRYRKACDSAWTALQRDCIHTNGFLGWVQGTGKDPSAGQPLSYTRIPDFEDFGLGCLLLGGAEYYRLLGQHPATSDPTTTH